MATVTTLDLHTSQNVEQTGEPAPTAGSATGTMPEAVLLLAHGTPDVLGEMATYLAKVTGGRPLPLEVVEELQHRYGEIGLGDEPLPEGPPLTRLTFQQGKLLGERLAAEAATLGVAAPRVYVGMRNWTPYIADVVQQMRDDGVRSFRAICLAPQNSRTSVGLYRRAMLAAAEGMQTEFVAGWAEHPLLARAFAERLWPVWAEACARAGRRVPVLFTAHSVPCRTIMTGGANGAAGRPGTQESTVTRTEPDSYANDAKHTAVLVAKDMAPLGMSDADWYFAFQSQGVAGGPWIGPSVEDTLKALATEGHRAVVLQPIGFLCDHVEILYDIDVAFRATAAELGMELTRAESLNGSPVLIEALASIATGRYAAEVDERVEA
jgi:ferrochelatase